MQKKHTYSTLPVEEKAHHICNWLIEKKGLDLLSLRHSEQQRSLADISIIVTATSVRHAQGLTDFTMEQCREQKFEQLHIEGYETGQWILLDLNDILVHIMLPDAREQYKLDTLWSDAAILMDNREDHDND